MQLCSSTMVYTRLATYLFIFIIFIYYSEHNFDIVKRTRMILYGNITKYIRNKKSTSNGIKQILLWPKPYYPLYYIPLKSMTARLKRCKTHNCDFHINDNISEDELTKYDAILFPAGVGHVPTLHSSSQIYIYSFSESTTNYPVKSDTFSNTFHWIMSYRLSSDIKIPYVSIYDHRHNLVGPNTNMVWRKNMKPISVDKQKELKSKKKLAAIFVSNCKSMSDRMKLVKRINDNLRNTKLSVDIFGKCGNKSCDRSVSKDCYRMLQRDYFFYLAFENSFAIDYVTEKVLHAVETYTVPVVYGGADYSRFLPRGSYINACSMEPAQLARTLVNIMSNWTRYFDYFRFKNHYTYRNSEDSLPYVCDLCKKLNDRNAINNRSLYRDFAKWYNQDISMTCS